MAITKRQRQVYDFISSFVQSNGYSPSFEEIGEGLGLSSLATVHKHISNLEKKRLPTPRYQSQPLHRSAPAQRKAEASDVSQHYYGAAAHGADCRRPADRGRRESRDDFSRRLRALQRRLRARSAR